MEIKRKVEVVGRRLELTDAIRHRVQEMADKLYEHDAEIDRLKVELEMERHSVTHQDEFSAKGQIDDGRCHHLAAAKGDDLYAVIGRLEEKLDRLIRRASRLKVTQRRHAKRIDLDADLPKLGDLPA